MGAPVACAKAERDNSTGARLSTARFCSNCKPVRRPICRGRTCQGKADPQRTQPAGCCSITKNGKRLHCARCCAANQDRRLQRTRSAKASRSGLASGAARKKRVEERRQKVRLLRQSGTDATTIANQLEVSMRIVQNDIKIIQQPTKAARAANITAAEQRRKNIGQLHAHGATPEEIAARVGLTIATVKRTLKLLRGTPTGG